MFLAVIHHKLDIVKIDLGFIAVCLKLGFWDRRLNHVITLTEFLLNVGIIAVFVDLHIK